MSVDNGQMEAGRSLGLSYGKTMRLIILPQAFKNVLPAMGNELITLLKGNLYQRLYRTGRFDHGLTSSEALLTKR